MSKKYSSQKSKGRRARRPAADRKPEGVQGAPVGFQAGLESSQIPEHSTALGLRQQMMLNLQRRTGNQGAAHYLARKSSGMIQRVEITQPGFSETLYNEQNAAGQFTDNTYTGGGRDANLGVTPTSYEMTRSPGGVTVNVRIRFVAEFGRTGADARAAQPVPEGPARDSAQSICTSLVTFWNNKFELIGRLRPAPEGTPTAGGGTTTPAAATTTPAAGTTTGGTGAGATVTAPPGTTPATAPAPASRDEIRLPVTFAATPVFDLAAAAHSTVRFDASTVADAQGGRVINAANWYANMDPNVYGGTVGDTYAHEYGHLLGIPDEYSINNPTAHALMHQLSPSQATQANGRLDDAATNQMILAALRPQLRQHLAGAGREIAASLSGQHQGMTRLLGSRLREAWGDASLTENVRTNVRTQLEAAEQRGPASKVNQVLNFQTRQNLSNRGIARNVVTGELNQGALQSMVMRSLNAALNPFNQRTVTLPGAETGGTTPSMTLEVAPGVSAAGSPLAASAQSLAGQVVGAPETPGRGRRIQVYPSGTLLEQLTTLPSQWTDLAAGLEPVLQYVQDDINMAVETTLAQNDVAGRVNNRVRNLYQVMYNLVNNATVSAAQIAIRSFVDRNINTKIEDQVTELMELIRAEIGRHSSVSGTGTTTAPDTPPDPQLMAAAQQIQQQARALVNPPAPTGGGNAPQNVRYTMNSLMGNNAAGTGLRTDQMQGITNGFNSNSPDLRRADEDNFNIRRTG